jgi:hypothetical protein
VQSKYLITFASLITAALINSAWCQQDQKMRPPADRQAAPTQNDPSEPCAGLDGREWRECMRANPVLQCTAGLMKCAARLKKTALRARRADRFANFCGVGSRLCRTMG